MAGRQDFPPDRVKTPDIPVNKAADATGTERPPDDLPARAEAGSEAIAAEVWVQTITHLAALAGAPCSVDQAQQAVTRALREPLEPMARLMVAAKAVGLRVTPIRANVADAVWTADAMAPLIAWSRSEQRWIVIRKHGPLRARVSTPDAPLERESIGRFALAKRLGLDSVLEVAEFGVVHAERLAEGLLGRAQGHGHDGHHGAPVSPVRRYLGVIRPESADVAAVVVFGVVIATLYLALPLAVNSFVSNLSFGSQAGPFLQALLFLGFALFVALALSAFIRGLQIYTAEVIQRRLFVRLAADLSYRLPRVKAEALEGLHAPELVNRFLDIVTVQKVTARLLLDGVEVVLGATIGTLVLGFYHPTLLVFSLAVCLGIAGTVLAGRGALRANIHESHIKYEIVGWLEELARHRTVFKGPGGYALARERSDALARRFLQARKGFFRLLMRQVAGALILEVVAISSLLIVGGWLVLNQQLTLGQLVASELIVAMIVYSVSKLGRMFEAWYDGMAATDKIGHLVDLEVERSDGESVPPQPVGMRVEVRDLAFTYASGRRVFSGIDLDLAPGECVSLWGAQGTGSSTLLNLLIGMGTAQEGFIRLDRMDVRSWNLEELREQVALLRNLEIVNGTIVDNVRLGRTDIGLDAVTAALDEVGLLDDVLSLPFGLATTLISGGLPLSSRQRLRLLMARAVVLQPRLLLLDEILDGVDAETMSELFGVLRGPRARWTVLIATRDPSVVEHCSRALRLDERAGRKEP